jgi:hypothetical protein
MIAGRTASGRGSHRQSGRIAAGAANSIRLRRQPGSDTTQDGAKSFKRVLISSFRHALSFRSEHVPDQGNDFTFGEKTDERGC